MGGELVRRQAVINLAKGWSGGMAAREKPKARRRMDIEAALRWAYRDELPKTPRAALPLSALGTQWKQVSEFLDELSLAGLAENRFGVVSDPFAAAGPHPDAVAIHYAVQDLREFDIDMPDGWPFLAGGAGALRCAAQVRDLALRQDADGRMRPRFSVPMLLAHHAIMSDAPDWRIEDYAETVETWPNGRPKYFKRERQWFEGPNGPVEEVYEVAVQVTDLRRRADQDEVYTRPVLSPDPTDDLVSRAKYEVWRAALDVLAIDLEVGLQEIEITPSARPYEPWVDGEAAPPRVLPDLSAPRWPWLRFAARGELRGARKKSSSGA